VFASASVYVCVYVIFIACPHTLTQAHAHAHTHAHTYIPTESAQSSLASSVYGKSEKKPVGKSPSVKSSGGSVMWRDVRKGRDDLTSQQLTCECCGYWVIDMLCVAVSCSVLQMCFSVCCRVCCSVCALQHTATHIATRCNT